MIAVDANILLYAYDPSDQRHARAAAWLEEKLNGAEEVGLAVSVVLAFIRIATDPRVHEPPMGIGAAVEVVATWLDRPNVQVMHPTMGHWRILGDLARTGQARRPLVMDAHLATLTIEHGATLATTDRDFLRFPGLRTIDPTAV